MTMPRARCSSDVATSSVPTRRPCPEAASVVRVANRVGVPAARREYLRDGHDSSSSGRETGLTLGIGSLRDFEFSLSGRERV